jgi:hypothetical protein
MPRIRSILVILLFFSLPAASNAEIVERIVEYKDGKDTLERPE